MDLTERQLSRETIYEGNILHIYRDDVLLPNGRTSVREVADHPGGVAIVALDENDNCAHREAVPLRLLPCA